jgi:hypothetical protein
LRLVDANKKDSLRASYGVWGGRFFISVFKYIEPFLILPYVFLGRARVLPNDVPMMIDTRLDIKIVLLLKAIPST